MSNLSWCHHDQRATTKEAQTLEKPARIINLILSEFSLEYNCQIVLFCGIKKLDEKNFFFKIYTNGQLKQENCSSESK